MHANDSLIGEELSQVAQTRHRLDGECIDWRDEGGDAVKSAGACEDEAVVGGDGGVCWTYVRGDEDVERGGRRTGASLLSWVWWYV